MRTTLLSFLLLLAACGTDGSAPTRAGESRGTLRLVVTVTGADADSAYTVGIADGDTIAEREVRAGVVEDFDVTAGTRTVTLGDLTPNCRVVEGLPLALEVVAGRVTQARLTIQCEAFAFVQVTVLMVGLPLPTDGLTISCVDINCGTAPFQGGKALLRMTAGAHSVGLTQVWCTSQSPRPDLPAGVSGPSLAVLAVAGDTTRYDLPLDCTEDIPPP